MRWLLWVLVLFACSEPSISRQTRPIVNAADEEDPTTEAMYPGIVALRIPQRADSDAFGFCTGTLISPSHVVTAAHCTVPWGGPEAGRIQVMPTQTRAYRATIEPPASSSALMRRSLRSWCSSRRRKASP